MIVYDGGRGRRTSGSVLGVHTGELAPEHLENLTATLADLDAGTITASQARERLAGLL